MGGVSIRRVLRPLLWLVWLVLLALVLPVLLLALMPFMLLFWLLGLIPMLASEWFRTQMNVSVAGYLLFGITWPVLLVTMMVPALALAVAAVLHYFGGIPPGMLEVPGILYRELSPDWRRVIPAPNLSLQDWAWIFIAIGAIGVGSHFVYAFLDVPWRIKQIRQLRALPRSKARSAAIGLAEFEGVARLLPARGEPPRPGEMQPFLLEDETGHILVDPRGVPLRPRSQSGVSLQLNEVEEGIREGDRVYVMGNVQRRDAGAADGTGPDRLVVRPLRQSLVSSPLGRLLFPPHHQVADRDAANIFIVDRGGEHDVAMRLRMSLWDFSVMGVAYVAAALWLVHAAWQWLN